MRDTCLYCVAKHLGKALINIQEVYLGYPKFMLLVIGNLSEAEDEALKKYPALAEEIRQHRKKLQFDETYMIPYLDLYEKIRDLQAEEKKQEQIEESIANIYSTQTSNLTGV
jgi:hypothetical protein